MEASKLRLWEISDALSEIGELLAENGGELTPELGERLDALEGAFEEKVERIALFVRECEANAIAATVERDRLAAIAKRFTTKGEGLKNYLLFAMRRNGHTSIKTPRVSVREQKNGRPAIHCVAHWTTLPPEFVKHPTPVIDTQYAYEQWKAGVDLPDGFTVDTGTHLRIS